MVTGLLKERILAETIRIAEDMYEKRMEDENGIYWKNLTIDYYGGNSVISTVSEGLYSGISGIALFYLALYKITNEKKYLNICKDAMKWVLKYCEDNKSYDYSFITGRLGVSYVLIKLGEVCKENYLGKALNIVKDYNEKMMMGNLACEFLSGLSGTILGFLHLYDATKEEWLLNKINNLIKLVIKNSLYNSKGIHWDINKNVITSLTGFSHGAAGIGFVFLELGNYFNNPAFYYISEQAFKYESNYYDENAKNWKDLRKGMYLDESEKKHREAYFSKNYDFFSNPDYMSAWCHGAPGIGLSRLRAYELIRKSIYKSELKICIKNVLNNSQMIYGKSYSLCHSVGGNLDLVIDYLRMFRNDEYKNKLLKIIEEIIADAEKQKKYISGLAKYIGDSEDFSIFNGNSGIGYFYLRIIAPDIVDSILKPSLKTNHAKSISNKINLLNNFNYKVIREIIVSNVFKKTLMVYSKLYRADYNSFFSKNQYNKRINEISEFKKNIEKILKSKTKTDLLKDIYSLEKEKLDLENKIKSYSLISARSLFQKELINDILKEDNLLLNSKLKINPDVRVYKSKFDWTDFNDKDTINLQNLMNTDTTLIFFATDKGTIEKKISPFCYKIISVFKNENYVKDAIIKITKLFGKLSADETKKIKEKILEQIKILLNDIILLRI